MMTSQFPNLKIKSSTVLHEPNGIHYLKIYCLKSGKVLTENRYSSHIYYSIYDLTTHAKLTTYQHETLRSHDRDACYLPEGPVLKPFNETLDLSLTQLFEYRLAVQYPDYYWTLHKPICKIAYIGNKLFVVLNQNSIFLKNAVFDLFLMQNQSIKKIGKLHNNNLKFQNPFFSSFSNYTCRDTQQIFSNAEDWMCIIYQTNKLDIWKKTSKKTFELYASFDIKEKLNMNKYNLSVTCLAITPGDMLICQVKKEHIFICFLKINLREKKLCAHASISRNHIDTFVDHFYGLQSIKPIGNSNLYIGTTYFTDEIYLIDINSMSVQKFLPPSNFSRPIISSYGEVITHNSESHSIDCMSVSYIENYLATQKRILDEERKSLLYQFIYPLDVVNIVNHYTDDYFMETNRENKSQNFDLSNDSTRRFSFFYNKPDWIDRACDNPLEIIEKIVPKKIFK